MTLRCLWIRGRIGPYLDQALAEGRARVVARHLSGCAHCQKSAHRQARLSALAREVAVELSEPNWTGFWPGIRARILSEAPLAGRAPWRSRPAWSLPWLPRLAVGSAVAGLLLLSLFLWQSDDRVEPPVTEVVVRALEMPNPNASAMVFSVPEHEMTVIWVFGLDPSGDQSLRQTEEMRGGHRVPSLPARAWS